ncbi:protein kinase [Gordonia desulfuricans]|uniref:non-specific serine/threonine protein kinase n=1 Tax=Gordonia desulfuricans TaxID=89051 RepID=A0A7K3LII2_9ACTN|nr:serine/threonine-protein kinase [Gordonia desulfuricans]NDK88078.1 protein kinase [Gordonia desulfuricans]
MGQTAPRVGEVFGPYRLESLLGRGGMGEVYRAHDTTRDRDVALKLLPAHLAADPSFQERFRRECQKLARLGEPHIIPIHDYGEIDSTLFLDMRLVDGRDLRAILTDRGRLDPAAAIGLIEQVAAALDAAHAAGLVHRDIKPDNVLVTDSGFAYLIDFGVAHADNEAHLTKTGTAIGSLAYMSPEQFENAPVTSVSDVYSLAAVLFELLTGRQPYPGDSVSAVTRGVLFDEVPVPSQVVPSIEPALDEVVAWGLCKTPAQRCPSALEFAAAARAALSGERPRAGADNPMVSLSKAPPTLAPPTPAVPVGTGAPAGTAERAPETITAGSPPAPSAIDPTLIRPHPLPAHQVTEVAGHLAAGHSAPHQVPPPRVPTGPVAAGIPPAGYPQGGYPPWSPPPASGGRSTAVIVLATLLGVLVVGILGMGGWVLADSLGSSDDDATAATQTLDQPVADQQTGTVTAPPLTTITSTPTYVPAAPPPDNQQCAPGVGTGYPQWTGCEFAINVRDAYVSGGPLGSARVVNGWAPQQRKWYAMSCDPYAGIIACRGGNQAVVYVY